MTLNDLEKNLNFISFQNKFRELADAEERKDWIESSWEHNDDKCGEEWYTCNYCNEMEDLEHDINNLETDIWRIRLDGWKITDLNYEKLYFNKNTNSNKYFFSFILEQDDQKWEMGYID